MGAIGNRQSAIGNGRWAMDNRELRNPATAADVIIELDGGRIVLIERRNEPLGWAIPGGFIDYGESAEAAAVREAREETSLDVELIEQLKTYSDPGRDPRGHTLTVVFIARAEGTPRGGDDARRAIVVDEASLPQPLAFDHDKVLAEYFHYKRSGERPRYRRI
jgi:ADP-ribose pyrophosphatase YjhB (NUDIX family)